jgi:hypothetical protein
MRFRVRSGDLNKIIHRPMMLKEWTNADMMGIIKEAFDKEERKETQVGELIQISAVPFEPQQAYWIETKAALRKLGLLKGKPAKLLAGKKMEEKQA